MLNMSLWIDLVSVLTAAIVLILTRRYFIMTSGSKKTKLKFCPSFNLFTGSNDIVFCHDKVMAVKAHDQHQKLGDTFGCYFGQYMQVFTRDPDLIYKICVSEFTKHQNRYQFNSLSKYMQSSLLEARDTDWQTSRRAIGSVLKASKLKNDNVHTDIDEGCMKVIESINRKYKSALANGCEPLIDVHQVLKNFVMHSILKIIFDTDNMVDFDSSDNTVVEDMHKFVTVNYEWVARQAFLMPILAHFIRPILHLFDHGKFLGLLSQRIEEILIMNAKSRERMISPNHRLTTIHSLINSYRKGELTRDQLMGNGVFLLLAGFATSVDSMSSMLWELARNQRVQDKLRLELGQYGSNSPYLDQCINETLRLYPGSLTNRDMGEHLYYKEFRLVKGCNVNMSIYSLHRDPKYWGDDAEVWDPDRFNPDKVAKHHPAQFIPFGIGPRHCVGYNLAKLEIIKFMTSLLVNYKLEFCKSTPQKVAIMALGALPYALPVEGPIYLKLTKVRD